MKSPESRVPSPQSADLGPATLDSGQRDRAIALQFQDSFDHLTTATLHRKWNVLFGDAAVGTAPELLAAAGLSGQGLRLGYISRVYKSHADLTTIIAGFAFRPSALIASRFAAFMDEMTVQVGLYLTTGGKIEIRNGSGTLLATSNATLAANQWSYIEIKTFISNTLGTYNLHVNGVADVSGTSKDTQYSSNAYVDLFGLSGTDVINTYFDFDNLYILDTTGSRNNDFLGPVSIDCLYTNGIGSSAQFTPVGALHNYLAVQDNPTPDDLATYVYASVNGYKDVHEFEDIRETNGHIFGVGLNLVMKKTFGGVRSAVPVLRPGTFDSEPGNLDYNGGTLFLQEDFSVHTQLYDSPPGVAAGTFTARGINALKAGYQRVT